MTTLRQPAFRCRCCTDSGTITRRLAGALVREHQPGLLAARGAGFFLPYCSRCRPRRLVDRYDLEDILIREVRYGLFPGVTLHLFRPCPAPRCTIGRWPAPSGSRGDQPCPWCHASDPAQHRDPHQHDFALWAQELRTMTPPHHS